MRTISVSTPGRICLFGEHQDYLGLPVIAAGISLRVSVTGTQRADKEIHINLPNIHSTIIFDLDDLTYTEKRDYFKSAIVVLKRKGFTFKHGIDAEVSGNIPINAGTSSSSALLVAWVHLMIQMSENPEEVSPETIAEWAYEAEVIEFNEAGGMMDQYATAVGNVIYLESKPNVKLTTLTPTFGTFVLGNSKQPKDTQGILARVKYGMLAILDKVQENIPGFSLEKSAISMVDTFDFLTDDELLLLKGNLSDRDILREAKALLEKEKLDDVAFGRLLSAHFTNLRDAKGVSTEKINRMVQASLDVGALGAKINGSGGGGCMFAYAPTNPEAVAEAIEKEGGEAFILRLEPGTRIDI